MRLLGSESNTSREGMVHGMPTHQACKQGGDGGHGRSPVWCEGRVGREEKPQVAWHGLAWWMRGRVMCKRGEGGLGGMEEQVGDMQMRGTWV